MARKEKLGRFVLLEELEGASFGTYYRAAKLGVTSLERLVCFLRLAPAISSHAEAATRLMDQVKLAAQLQSANVVKVYAIGKFEGTYYVSQELVEGKSLAGILARCGQDAFPFAVDHALLVASKACAALEVAHARKDAHGLPYFHGFLNPSNVLISYEGDVRLRGFGLWPGRVREVIAPAEAEARHLAPEQLREGGGPRSDLFAVGTILFETLTGQPFVQGERGDLDARLAQARLLAPGDEEDTLPAPIADILRRALAADPAARFPDAAEMRKAIDVLLFSGDFAPTTFNLAFFMHSLFRPDLAREEKTLEEERTASYQEYLEPPAPPAAPVAAAAPSAPMAEPAPPPPEPAPPLARAEPAAAASASPGPRPVPAPASRVDSLPPRPAAELTFQGDPSRSRAPVEAIVLVVVAAAAVGLYFATRRPASPAAAPPTLATPPPEAAAALARVKELEGKLRAMEAEKAAATAKAADDAKQKVVSQAAAKGQAADPAAVQRAQEEARRKAQAEQERRIQQERTRLAEEERKAEQARLAEQQRRAAAESPVPAAVVATPPPAPVAAASPPPPTFPPVPAAVANPAPALKPGTLVGLNDPGVIAPVAEKAPPMPYPPIARRQRVEGTVELSVLVDERGQVIDTKLLTPAGGRMGLNEAAVESARKRHYRPATKDGVPVRVWVPVRVKFELPR